MNVTYEQLGVLFNLLDQQQRELIDLARQKMQCEADNARLRQLIPAEGKEAQNGTHVAAES